jgi:hypothetical protein
MHDHVAVWRFTKSKQLGTSIAIRVCNFHRPALPQADYSPLVGAGIQCLHPNEETDMFAKWIALMGLAALLSACAHAPGSQASAEPWNGGIWNSVLGYHGPANAMIDGGP